VAGDISGRLDLEQMLSGLVDHASVLFQADRAAIFLRRSDGRIFAEVSHGLSPAYLASVRDFPTPSLPAAAVVAREPLYATGYADDPRGGAMRAAVIQEGRHLSPPLFDRSELLGLLNVYHDRPHPWSQGELDTMAAFAAARSGHQDGPELRADGDLGGPSAVDQQLGAKLNGLTSVSEIGQAMRRSCASSSTTQRPRLSPVRPGPHPGRHARPGRQYVDDARATQSPDGRGITAGSPSKVPVPAGRRRRWQGEHDRGTEPTSTIDAPRDDLRGPVLGVWSSKLGLHQFSDDDLRLLVIYASLAAQAMANADTTEALRAQTATLERQLRSQRELLHITESILVTLDSRAVLDQITDRLDSVVHSDNIAIELLDRAAGVLRPLTAKGVNADQYLEAWLPGEEGSLPGSSPTTSRSSSSTSWPTRVSSAPSRGPHLRPAPRPRRRGRRS
jgi:GAF domain-containing protein